MVRYVIDVSVVMHLLTNGLNVAPDCRLVAPSSIRSGVLNTLFGEVQRGRLTRDDGLALHASFSTMKIRLLGDKVLRRRAWEIAEDLGWDSTERAEFIALTQLQADALVTLDDELARAASGRVQVAPIDDLIVH